MSLPIRSAERRRWAADLATPAIAGLVLCGVGGIGKSTLAAQIASRMSQLEPARVTAVFSGGVSVNQLLAGVSAALRRHPAVAASSDRAAAARAAERTDLPWAHRLTMLREQVLGHVPVLVVLDNFDDSVPADSGGRNVRDPALAEFIAGWARATHRGKLLITCRHPFSQPAAAALPLRFRHVGPLSRSGAFELAKSLPALGRLGEPELDRAWRLLGGHPLAMKYLDSLLATREISFPEVTRRIAHAIGADGGSQWPTGPAAPTELPPAGAETIMVAAGDLLLSELLDHLSAGAQDVLIRASAHGGLTGPGIVTLPGGQEGQDAYPVPLVAECAAAGLLTTGPPTTGRGEPGSMSVHPWTAEQILRLAEARRSGEAPPGTPVHTARRRPGRGWPSRRMTAVVAAAAAALASTVISVLVAQRPGPATTGPGAPPRTAAMLRDATAIRTVAAAWVAQQVSRSAILACDPHMCSALLAMGIAPGDLLELGAGTPDPLGSDVVLATAAVRSQFGGRLASVYAPGILASFGSGGLRIDVRAVALDGAAGYGAALASDLVARQDAGAQLLGNSRLHLSAAARSELRAGRVDSRLLTTLAAVTSTQPVQVSAFEDSGPGAGREMPLRSASITVSSGADPASLQAMIAFVRAQRPPYLPTRSLIGKGPDGSPVLTLEFAAPSPAGLLQPEPAH